jgi:hypothetical protein
MGRDPMPFIVWTLRRTGGTNFAHSLMERSPFSGTQHEPFNEDRVYGHITRAWRERGDAAELRAGVIAICEKKVVMKHCLEIIPPPVNRALVRASIEVGYRHVFLYRREAMHRLLSLEFAQRSGLWQGAVNTDINDRVFSEPLRAGELVHHELQAREEMGSVYRALREAGQEPVSVAFEDLFTAADRSQAERMARDVLQALALERTPEEDRGFFAHLLGSGDQGMKAEYKRFAGYQELVEALQKLGPFSPSGESASAIVAPWPPAVAHCAMWPPTPSATPGQFIATGAVVLTDQTPAAQLYVEDAEGRKPVIWGLASQKIATTFPDKANARHARFEARDIAPRIGAPARLMIELPDHECHVLGQIVLHPAPSTTPGQL